MGEDQETTAAENAQQAPQTAENAEQQPADDEAAEPQEEPRTARNTVTIEEVGPCRKKVAIEVPRETIDEEMDSQFGELQRDAVLPGFRKGRAPRRLIEKRFGKDVGEQVKLKLLAEASEAAIEARGLDVLGEPDIDFEKITLPQSGPLTFDFEVEVRPEFELPELEGIPVTRPALEVTDEQVDREVQQLQRLAGVWTPREDAAAGADDQVIADVLLSVEGVEQQEKLDNIEVYVRANGFVGPVPVEKLDEVLAEAKPGDMREFDVEVSKTYFREEYRGKKVTGTIAVKEVKYLKPAELDEALLARFDAQDEDDLREKIRDALQSRIEEQARTQMTEQVHQYLLDKTDFDLPLDVVGRQAMSVLQRQYINLMVRGLSREQIEQQMEQLRAGSEEQARAQLKSFFIMDKVAKKLDISVTDEEVNGHVAQLAIQRGQRPERMREDMERDGSLAQFHLQVRDDKCIAKLLESAKVTQAEPEKAKPEKKPAKPRARKSKAKDDQAEADQGQTQAKPASKGTKKPKSSDKKKTED